VKISAAILAAGRSSRFEDGHKLLAEIAGIPVVRIVCETLAASRADDILLVTSKADGPVANAAGNGRWRVVENQTADDGLSTSLRVAVQNTAPDADGLLITLADMPGITTPLIDALISAFAADRGAIVFPVSAGGRRGHPILWPKSLFPDLANVSGDSGGKAILAGHPSLWRPVKCENEGAFADIDTRADLAEFRARDQNTRRK
jgi:molybdenum cofactor cytidylyltransferase